MDNNATARYRLIMPYCACGNPSRNVRHGGPCASCERAGRKKTENDRKIEEKRQTALSVPGKKRTAIKRQGDNNTFLCSDGTRVTQSQIDHNRSVAYKLKYPVQEATCHGCWMRKAHGSAHIIPQARAKQLNRTELIWDPDNFFPSCILCNQRCENVSSESIKRLLNYEEIKAFMQIYDPERASKLPC